MPEEVVKPKRRAARTSRKVSRKDADADAIVKAVRKSLGTKSETRVVVLGQEEDVLSDVTEWIPSGFPDLDRVLGGGWAVGRASEVYGDEGCGKSALSHMAIRQCQRNGGLAVLLDFESALDTRKLERMGIDRDRLLYSSPPTAEEGWDVVFSIVDQLRDAAPDAPSLIVWDSIAAAVPRDEREGKMESSSVGLHARIMTRGCRKMFLEISRVRAHMMWINQNRSKIGGFSGWGGPQTDTTGGRALKFAASQRVSTRIVKQVKPSTVAGTEPSGYIVKNKTDKCRSAPPHRSTEWILDFVEGPSPELTARHLLMEAGVIKRGKGPGRFRVPWTSEQFRKKDWLALMRDPSFVEGTREAMQQLVAAGGLLKYAAANKKAQAKEDDDEDE